MTVEQKMTERLVQLYPAPFTGWRRTQVKPQQPGLGVYGGGELRGAPTPRPRHRP